MSVRRIHPALAFLVAGFVLAAPVGAQTPPPVPTHRSEPFSFRHVVKGVLPAVVSIDAKISRNKLNAFRNDQGSESNDLRKFFDNLESKPAPKQPDEMSVGFGSGFIVDTRGIVLTNFHVVENADHVEITLTGGRKFTSRDIKSDKKTDLAIVRFDPQDAKLTALEFADSELMEVGDRVLAIGAPFGLSGSVTSGIISAKGRDVELNPLDDFLQTDAAINPGNSGGPLVNLDGKVIGVNSAIKSGSGGFQGVSFAISSNMTRSVMLPLIRDGVVKRPYIGIRSSTARKDASKPGTGVIVASVVAKAPAEKGGIMAKDAITSINGKPIEEFRDLTKAIANQPVGSTIELGILRDGKPTKVQVVLEEEPKDYNVVKPRPTGRSILGNGQVVTLVKAGLQLSSLTEEQTQRIGVKQSGAAIVHGVFQNGLADKAGIAPGTVILRVNDQTIDSAEDAMSIIEASLDEDGATLQIQVGRKISTVTLQAK